MSNIMENIPRPSFIDVSFSAPASVLPTRPPSSLAQAPAAAVSFSHPVSPIAKKVLSPIVRKKSSPKKMNSPDRLIRRRNSQVTFNNFNPRALKQDPQCPAHSYVGIEQELKVLPNKVINNAVKFSETPREAFEPLRPNCPVHVYQEAKTTLRSLGGTFTRAVDPAAPAKCPVHFYETPRSTLKKSGATAFSMDSRDAAFDSARRALAPVHAYETPRSTLKTSGATAFSTEHRGRNAFQNTGRPGSRAPVHSYETPRSFLKTTGGATFGSSARSSLLSVSRTGLITATTTPLKAPRTLKPLPALVPPSIVKPVVEEKAIVEEGDESPRDVISLLA